MAGANSIKKLPVTASASGDSQLIAAQTDKRIHVVALAIVAAGAVAVKFRSAGNDISGVFALGANGGLVLPFPTDAFPEISWFATNKNEALQVNLGGAVAIGGQLLYYIQ